MTDAGLSFRVHLGTWSWTVELKREQPEPEDDQQVNSEALTETELADDLTSEPQRLGFKK